MAFGDNMKEIEDPSLKNSEIPENYTSYIHEERIKNAPKIVQDYYAGKVCKFEKGLFKVLVAKKSNRIIFIVMIMLALIVFIKNNLSNGENIAVINGYECELASFSYDDTIYASVKIHPVKNKREEIKKQKSVLKVQTENTEKNVKISFKGFTDAGAEVIFKDELEGKIFDNQQFFRTSNLDCDIITVEATVIIDDESKQISAKVSKKLQ